MDIDYRGGSGMIKTIKVKKEFNFRELMEYILENDISGDFKCLDGKHRFTVNSDGTFYFGVYHYGDVETYEVEVEEEITEDTEFEQILINTGSHLVIRLNYSIKLANLTFYNVKEIFARIDGRVQLIWECNADE